MFSDIDHISIVLSDQISVVLSDHISVVLSDHISVVCEQSGVLYLYPTFPMVSHTMTT